MTTNEKDNRLLGLDDFRYYLGPLGPEALHFNGEVWIRIATDRLLTIIRGAARGSSPKVSAKRLRDRLTVTQLNLESRGTTFLKGAKCLLVRSSPLAQCDEEVVPKTFLVQSSKGKKLLVTNSASVALELSELIPGIVIKKVEDTKIGRAIARVLRDPSDREFWESRFIRAFFGISRGKEIFVLVGPKNTGKSLVKELMIRVFGTYGLVVDKALFGPSLSRDLRRRLYRKGTVRAVFVSEFHPGDKLDIGLLKELTDGRNIDSAYARVLVPEMDLNLRIFADTNAPLPRIQGDSLNDRVYYIPIGHPIAAADRRTHEELGLESQDAVNEYMTALILKWLPRLEESPPAPTRSMKIASKWEEIINAPITAFIQNCLIIGETGTGSHFDPSVTVERLYAFCCRYVRASHYMLCHELGFDFHPDGSQMTRQDVDRVHPGVLLKEFKIAMERATGQAATKETRSSRGHLWRNVIVKESVLFHLSDEKALASIANLHQIFLDIDADVQFFERVATENRQANRILHAQNFKGTLSTMRLQGEAMQAYTGQPPVEMAMMVANFVNTAAQYPRVAPFLASPAFPPPGAEEQK